MRLGAHEEGDNLEEMIDVDVQVLKSTDKAVLVETEDGEEVWLPLSQIEGDLPDEGSRGTIQVASWLAKKNGWT